MLKSMTGFGRAQAQLGGRDILVEIRSVNHRYFEFGSRLPRAYGYLDEKLKGFISAGVSRGKVEAGVTIQKIDGGDSEIKVNAEIAKGYIDALRSANSDLGLEDDLSLSKIMKLPDIFTVTKVRDDEEKVWEDVRQVAGEALERFVAMRETEGVKMKNDISSRLDFIEGKIGDIERISPMISENYKNRLYSKIKETLADTSVDEQRVLTEVAIFSEKVAVDEETVRLRSHISQFRELIDADEPVGRKLDFLVQEMNREVNTIGSKAQCLDVTKTVVDLKSEIEKIREQIQNVE